MHIVVAALLFVTVAAESAPKSRSKKTHPADVTAYLERLAECYRIGDFANSEAGKTDEAIKATQQGVEKNRCLQLDSDEKELREKYKARPELLKKIDDAKGATI